MSRKYIVWTIFAIALPVINVGIIAMNLIPSSLGVMSAGCISMVLVIWNDKIR